MRVVMPYLVYVIINANQRIYIGQTDNLAYRLKRHNAGLVRSTAPYRPWNLLLTEKYDTRGGAMKRERQLKSGQGRQYIRHLIGSSTPEAAGSGIAAAINRPTT